MTYVNAVVFLQEGQRRIISSVQHPINPPLDHTSLLSGILMVLTFTWVSSQGQLGTQCAMLGLERLMTRCLSLCRLSYSAPNQLCDQHVLALCAAHQLKTRDRFLRVCRLVTNLLTYIAP